MSDIQAVVFDVGRVLVRWDLRCLFARMESDPAKVEWIVANVVTESWHHQHDEGRDLAEIVTERIAEYPDCADYLHAYATRFADSIPDMVPGMPELVERLAARGVPLYALTNFSAPFWAAFRPTAALFDRFRDIVVSGVEKLAKPDPAIYALAERRFGHRAGDMLFIDDSLANIEAAARLGWQGHHFRDAQTLETDLVARRLL